MSTPTNTQVHINRPLTNISVAYMQDENEFIADKVFPKVPVSKKSDDFFVYDDEAFARAIANERSGATESDGSGWEQATDTYRCRQKSFHHDVPKDIAENTDEPLDAYRDATEFVTRAMLLKREKDFNDAYVKAGVWANEEAVVGATDKWDAYDTSDPYTQIQDWIRTVQKRCLVKPNKMIVGPDGFDALKNHPDLKDRYKYTTSDSLTVAMLSQTLGIQILVGEGVAATNKEGQAATMDYILGKNALLVYAAPRPSLLMPSAGYIFTWNAFGNGFGARIDRFPMRHLNNSQRVEGDMAYDTKIVSAAAGCFLGAVTN